MVQHLFPGCARHQRVPRWRIPLNHSSIGFVSQALFGVGASFWWPPSNNPLSIASLRKACGCPAKKLSSWRFVAVLLQNKGGLHFGAVVVVVAGNPVRCGNMPGVSTLWCSTEEQKKCPRHKRSLIGRACGQELLPDAILWSVR